MKRTNLALGLAIILASNVILLVRVARDRSGDIIQTIQLTEREAPLVSKGPEDSSVSLRIARRYSDRGTGAARPVHEINPTLDEGKLASLGFRCGTTDHKSPYFRIPQQRLLYVALRRAEPSAEPTVSRTSEGAQPAGVQAGISPPPESLRSNLIFVDAAVDFEQLRAKYPDVLKVIIVRGLVVPTLDDEKGQSQPRWVGRLVTILPGEIHVPLPYAEEIKRLAGEREEQARYVVTLHYGRNMEPWVDAVTGRSR